MEVYILPVSGKYFPNQLALLNLLLETGSRPNICLGSSGGNINIYMGLFGGWNPGETEKYIPKLNSDLFVKKVLNKSEFGIFKGALGGSMFDHSTNNIIEEIFTSVAHSIKDTEIWTGTFNTLRGKSHNFCNLSEDEAILKNDPFSNSLYGYANNVYLDGNVDMIHRVSRASATLPTILPPVIIYEEPYTDGGLGYPSPFYPFREQLNKMKENQQTMITYFLSHNKDKNLEKYKPGNIIGSVRCCINFIYNGFSISEYASLIEMVGSRKEKITSEEITLAEAVELRKKYKFSVFIMWPRYNTGLDLVNFNSENVLEVYEYAYKHYIFELWFDRKNTMDNASGTSP